MEPTNNLIDRHRLESLLNDLEEHFDVKLLWYENLRSGSLRSDVTFHNFFDPEHKVTDEMRRQVRCWLEDRRWQMSRQLVDPYGIGIEKPFILLAPMISVDVSVGYHATMRASVDSIMEHGLLPSNAARQTTERRLDCEGNIYICGKLGRPADVGVRGSDSAHWWRGHLAEKNRFNEPEWVILRIEVGQLAGVRTYMDLWSTSGIVISNVEAVPPHLIRCEYPGS